MSHGPASQWGDDPATPRKTRLGLILFAVYSFLYLVFILINTLAPKWMGIRVMFDLNLAVVYGFFLILLPIAMGVVYNIICTRLERESVAAGTDDKRDSE